MPIASVVAEPIEGRVRRETAIVSSLGEHVAGQYVLVRVHDDAGRTGLGEASVTSVWSGETQAGTVALIREVLAPLVVGADPFDTAWIEARMRRVAFGNSFARAALENALLDLQGKVLGVPLYKLLGGRDAPAAAVEPGVRFVLGTDRGVRLKFVVGKVEPSDQAAFFDEWSIAAGRRSR